ncbi:hypothetical protein A9Q94_07590 [Rhodobacterales bacterium 56_14_T64]|nr:hypothetical protein A9Q94_07590 [Rhodobacterales bacterium 56_14_T64]
MSDQEKEFEVGYGKPPKNTRFKKGVSGNPNGRRKGTKNVGSMVRETFMRKITITENGKKKRVPVLEALLRQLVNGALKGEVRHMDRVLKLLPVLQESLEQEKAVAASGIGGDSGTDMAILNVLADMLGGDPEELFATVQGGFDHECPEF